MAFGWLVAFWNNCISTNIYSRFESFRFFNQEITLVAGLGGFRGLLITPVRGLRLTTRATFS
jgi:hypothetical protein